MKLAFIATFFANIFIGKVNSVLCYDCRADDGTCNVGECEGAVCIKMETINIDNGRKTVYKSCNNEFEETQCRQSGFGSKLISRCSCETNFCNGEKNLIDAGLQMNSVQSIKNLNKINIYKMAIILILFVFLN